MKKAGKDRNECQANEFCIAMSVSLARRNFILASASSFSAFGGACAGGQRSPKARDGADAFSIDGLTREQFFRRAPEVEGKPDRERVRKLLGDPDEIWKVNTPADLDSGEIRPEEIWRYGVDRPNGLATLGQVHFEKQWTMLVGGRVPPPPRKVISEDKLRSAMSFLYDSTSSSINADPLHLVRSVNKLRPLGKDAVLAVLEQFTSVTAFDLWPDWLILLLRVLFEPPHPPSNLPWAANLDAEPNPLQKRYRRFPMMVVGDVPLHVFVFGGGGSGPPARVEDELPFYRKTGKLRDKNLSPTDDPFSVVGKLIEMNPRGEALTPERVNPYSYDCGRQLFRLVRTAFQPKGKLDFFALKTWRDIGRSSRLWDAVGASVTNSTFAVTAASTHSRDGSTRIRMPNGSSESAALSCAREVSW